MKKSLAVLFFLSVLSILFFAVDLTRKPQPPSQTGGCPFCQEKVIQSQLFYRGKEILGILTHKPAVPGHVLIIPARHVERFEDLTPSEIAEMGEAIKKVDSAVRRLYNTTGYVLMQKNGREAGQSVPHVHFHYIPNKEGGSALWLFVKYLFSYYCKPLTYREMESFITPLRSSLT